MKAYITHDKKPADDPCKTTIILPADDKGNFLLTISCRFDKVLIARGPDSVNTEGYILIDFPEDLADEVIRFHANKSKASEKQMNTNVKKFIIEIARLTCTGN